VAWFLGDNDSRTPMYDPVSGGGFDGLERFGRNENQGAESTLAVLSTFQRTRRCRSPSRRPAVRGPDADRRLDGVSPVAPGATVRR